MLSLIGGVGTVFLLIGLFAVFGALQNQGLLGRLRRAVMGCACLLIGTLCLSLSMALHAFRTFTYSTSVAEVHCKWVGPRLFELTYQEVRDGKLTAPSTVRLRGDQWAISGGVVKWHPWLTALGVPSYHKPTRLSGRYADVAEERMSLPTAFELNGGMDRTWEWFYRAAPMLPFVEAVYGSSAFVYVNPAVCFEVLVTPSGYLIERHRAKPRAALTPHR